MCISIFPMVRTCFTITHSIDGAVIDPMMSKQLDLMMQWSLVSDAAMVPCYVLNHPCGKIYLGNKLNSSRLYRSPQFPPIVRRCVTTT